MALTLHKSIERVNEFPCVRAIGRKRVAMPTSTEFNHSSPMKFRGRYGLGARRTHLEVPNHIESLPEDLLVKIIVGVDHLDLLALSMVSKRFREATLIAKKHFAFKTPTRDGVVNERNLSDNEEFLNAPRQRGIRRPRLSAAGMRSLSVVLFP